MRRNIYKTIFFLLFFLLLIHPRPLFAAMVDLSIAASDIRFSVEKLIAGDRVRLYASVKNIGDVDVQGYVSFYQGTVPVGDSQVISLLAGGSVEEVYVDFVIPSGAFNIRAEIRGTDPEDGNTENNTAITGMFQPIFDDDRDEIQNASDNCSSSANADQTDSDRDGVGDVCDDDDDDDGLTDEVEREMGSNPSEVDTDADGIADNEDSYPNKAEPTVKKKEEPATAVAGKTPESPVSVVEPIVDEIQSVKETFDQIIDRIAESLSVAETPHLPVDFTYHREAWNVFQFEVLFLEEQEHYAWDFGDGITSSRGSVVHKYDRPGIYEVSLKRSASDASESIAKTVVRIPFFSIHNPMIFSLMAVLSLTLLALIAISLILSHQTKKSHA